MVKMILVQFVAFALMLSQHNAHAFSVHRTSWTNLTPTAATLVTSSIHTRSTRQNQSSASKSTPAPTHISRTNNADTTRLYNSQGDQRPDFQKESEQRGLVILGFAFLLCVWSFSIPPEFRREHWCFTDNCVENRSTCYDCVTVSEFYNQIKDYYAGGGGVNFDFSVEGR